MRCIPLVVLVFSACATGARAQSTPSTLPGASAAARDGGRDGTADRASDRIPDAGARDGKRDAALDPESLGARAEALASAGDRAGAAAAWETYARLPELREHERIYARGRIDALAGRPRAAPSRTTSAASYSGPGDPRRLGLLVPLSGRDQALGERMLRGAMLALAGQPAAGDQAAFELRVRDAAAEHGPLRAATELARDEIVVGAAGSGDRQLGVHTTTEGVPFLAIESEAPPPGSSAFAIIHSSEARAGELARRALAKGARSFAILGPDSAAGKRLAEAFARAVVAGGGRLLAQAAYSAGATSFAVPISQIKRAPFEALFVPDTAVRLELVASGLAFADLWAHPWGGPPAARPVAPVGSKVKRRDVLLLSTASGLSTRLLRNAGRYVQGSLLAPGFFADEKDPRAAAFVARHRALYGQDPGVPEAFGYDAVSVLRSAALDRGRTRTKLLEALQAGSFDGVTGTIRFAPDHTRADPPPVYVVDGDTITALR